MTRINKATLHDNKGFSLAEMIIVIAIIAIMTGISFVTISLLNSAKAKDAAVTFDSELSDMITKTKNQVCIVAGKQKTSYSRCLMLYRTSDDKYYVKTGYYNPKGTGVYEGDESTYNSTYGSAVDESTRPGYVFFDSDNANDGKGISLSNRVIIKYRDNTVAGSTENTIVTVTDAKDRQFITYNREGKCTEGYGVYKFYKKNGSIVADVSIQKNGSHQSD